VSGIVAQPVGKKHKAYHAQGRDECCDANFC
jgi:hypothetical protein